MTLRDSLADDWHDVDVAEHAFARLIGVVPPDSEPRHYKWLYWSNNSLGTALHECLMELAHAGILEVGDGETVVRWSPTWQPPDPSVPLDT